MTVNEFLKLIDLESHGDQGIKIIIAVKEKINKDHRLKVGELHLSENEKVILDASEYSFEDYELYDQYGIDVCFKSENENDEDYENVDLVYGDDFGYFVYNEDGEVWVVI